MGYTHYWTQKRDMTRADWNELTEGAHAVIGACLLHGIALVHGDESLPDPATIDAQMIAFNGLGEGAHEHFIISRKRPALESWQDKSQRGKDFCKTAQKPYDIAVAAILAYLDSIHGDKWIVSSDGNGTDWEAGVELARKAWPNKANQITAPRAVREHDRYARYYDHGDAYQIALAHSGGLYIERHRDKRRALLPFADASAYADIVKAWGHAYRKSGSFRGDEYDACTNRRLSRVWAQYATPDRIEAPEIFAPLRA